MRHPHSSRWPHGRQAAGPSPRQLPSRLAALAVVAVLVALTGWLPSTTASANSTQPTMDPVRVTVLQLMPTSPQASLKPQPFNVSLRLTNTTGKDLGKLTVRGVRGDPISNQAALDAAISNPRAPDPSLVSRFDTERPVTVTLPAYGQREVTYASTTGTSPQTAGLCLCENRIYPLYFTVHRIGTDGSDTVVGSAQAFIPSFATKVPKPVMVSWVWPILEPPHRTTSPTVFTDDDLAASVTAGRLDRLLSVVEAVAAQGLPLTVLIDPDLIDELQVMATMGYQVDAGDGHTVPGIGADAAASWLQRLRDALSADPAIELAFTPYADPDVEALAHNGLTWSVELPDGAARRVQTALGGITPPTDIAWPVGSTLSTETLGVLVAQGTKTVVVNDATMPGSKQAPRRPDALAPLKVKAGRATAAITSATIQRYAADVTSKGGPGVASLSELVAEVAVRAEQDGDHSHYVLITPPRNVDPDPEASEAAIAATSSTSWSKPLNLRSAVRTIKAVPQGTLKVQPSAPSLPAETLRAAHQVAASMPNVASLISDDDELTKLLGSPAAAIQRSESSEWVSNPNEGLARAQAVSDQLSAVTSGVQLIRPTKGTYTLGSEDAPLPITVRNTLNATVHVRIQIGTVGGLPGLSADSPGVQRIAPHSKLPLHIPLHVDRAGRFKVQVELLTPSAQSLGDPLVLSVRSTALGYIGKLITFGAGGVLAVALLFRVVRRLRARSGSARSSA